MNIDITKELIMKQYLFQKKEINKYKNLIPSRGHIIEYLTKRNKPINREELAAEWNIEGKEQIKAFLRRLHAMERDGQIIFTHQKCYIPNRLGILKGTVISHRNGYGFLRIEGRKDDLYLPPEQMKTCIHGDQVLAQQLLSTNGKGRFEARIIHILDSKINQIVGRYSMNSDGIGLVIPNDSRINFNILIPENQTKKISIGFIVVVELIQRPTLYTQAIGKIVEVLGDKIDMNIVIHMALCTYSIPYIWPEAVKKEIKDLENKISKISTVDRVDLRSLPLITIDDADANDFDDAVYCEKNQDGGWKLWVAIADVSYYVRPYSSLDHEARNRGTSVYFPSQVVPMLPEILSNNLCSLIPHMDRLCVVCEMIISSQGNVISYKFYEAIINSHARLTYTIVLNILQGNKELREQYSYIINYIEELYCLYKTLEKAHADRGGIAFVREEAKFIFNNENRIERIVYIKNNDAHKIIEECMILANSSAAHFIEQTKSAALFRIHEKPTNEAIITFRSILNEFGLKLPEEKNQPDSRDYAKLLKSISNYPNAEILQMIILRSMKQAFYDSENRGHFGLALQSYAHFTSPIRRYSDLSLHRVIKYLLVHKDNKIEGNGTEAGGYYYSINELTEIGQHCSMTERRADDAVHEVEDWLKCDFMLGQVGKTFTGVIISVTKFGLFVRLRELFIDGLIHISVLTDDYYYFDQIKQCLIGKFRRKIYRLGDYIEIRVKNVNIYERKIDFIPIHKEYISYTL